MKVLVLVALALLIVVLVPTVARQRSRSRVAGEIVSLFSQPAATPVGPLQLVARRDALPAPVRRYLQFALQDDAPGIRTVRVEHNGTFRTGPDATWFPVHGRQFFTAGTPGFIWHASLRMLPLVWIEARDRLEAGRGNMLVRALSVYTLADASGPEIDQGASLRWLGEAAWFPYAFVGHSVAWEAIDDRSARATLRQPGPPASAVFEFEEDGRMSAFRAERYRDVGGGKAVLTPFVGRCAEYREFGRFRVPTALDASWMLDTGEFTYARFRVTSIQYDE